MKEENYIGKATEELYNIFEVLNKKYFGGVVNMPVITIMRSKPNIRGHFSLGKVWKKISDLAEVGHEINISAHLFQRGIVSVCETLCHEMCHAVNMQNQVKDCSGQVHNKKFMLTASSAGLDCERDKRIGWVTSPSQGFVDFITDNEQIHAEVFEVFRDAQGAGIVAVPPKAKKKFNYTCGGCNKKFTSKLDDIRAVCNDCDGEFTLDD